MKSAKRTILVAGMGTSPAVLTEAVCKHRGLSVPLDDAYSADRAFEGELSQTGTAQTMTQKSNEELDPNRQAVGLAVGLGVGLGSLVLNEVTANPQIKMSEIALKYHVSKRTVERIFGKLSQDGRIVRVGGKRFGYWEVIG